MNMTVVITESAGEGLPKSEGGQHRQSSNSVHSDQRRVDSLAETRPDYFVTDSVSLTVAVIVIDV